MAPAFFSADASGASAADDIQDAVLHFGAPPADDAAPFSNVDALWVVVHGDVRHLISYRTAYA